MIHRPTMLIALWQVLEEETSHRAPPSLFSLVQSLGVYMARTRRYLKSRNEGAPASSSASPSMSSSSTLRQMMMALQCVFPSCVFTYRLKLRCRTDGGEGLERACTLKNGIYPCRNGDRGALEILRGHLHGTTLAWCVAMQPRNSIIELELNPNN